MTEWISVKDRLPGNCSEHFLVLVDDGDPGWFGFPHVSLWETCSVWAETGEYCDPYWEIEDEQEYPVTHWMPLPPEPPKEDEG